MATRSSIPAWRTPWMEEPGGLRSTGSQRAGHDWGARQARSLRASRVSGLTIGAGFTSVTRRREAAHGRRGSTGHRTVAGLWGSPACPGSTFEDTILEWPALSSSDTEKRALRRGDSLVLAFLWGSNCAAGSYRDGSRPRAPVYPLTSSGGRT